MFSDVCIFVRAGRAFEVAVRVVRGFYNYLDYFHLCGERRLGMNFPRQGLTSSRPDSAIGLIAGGSRVLKVNLGPMEVHSSVIEEISLIPNILDP